MPLVPATVRLVIGFSMLYCLGYVLHVRHANVLLPKAGRRPCRRCGARTL